jgi:hypothetical protein
MELATLPRGAVERGLERRFQAAVGIGGDEIGNADAAFLQSVQKAAPVDFRFRESATNAEDDAFAIVATNPVGDESGTVADDPVDADFVIGEGLRGQALIIDIEGKSGEASRETSVESRVAILLRAGAATA